MTRQRILHTVSMLFTCYGIKGMTMAQVATSLGISKKTLYQEFGDKEQLLNLCIQNELEALNRTMDELENDATSTLELIFTTSYELFEYFSAYCATFYKDIKMYPEVHYQLIELLADLKGRFTVFFQKGMDDGLFLLDGNYDSLSVVFARYLGPVESRPPFGILITCLRGICTKQGLEELERLKLSYPIF